MANLIPHIEVAAYAHILQILQFYQLHFSERFPKLIGKVYLFACRWPKKKHFLKLAAGILFTKVGSGAYHIAFKLIDNHKVGFHCAHWLLLCCVLMMRTVCL